jgi:hypothetical protein
MRKFMMAVAWGLMPGMGQACTYLAPFEMDQIGGADIVVVGKVTEYIPDPTDWRVALVKVEVEEVLKGEASGEVTFVWNGGMAQGPHENRAKGRVSDYAPDVRPDLPAIIQPYCGEVWMAVATKAVVKEAREVLQ